MAVRISPGSNTVIRVMSTASGIKNSPDGTTRSPEEFLMTIDASSATSAVAVSDGDTATHRLPSNKLCSLFMATGVSA